MVNTKSDLDLLIAYGAGKKEYPNNRPPKDQVLAVAYELGRIDAYIGTDFKETKQQIVKYIKSEIAIK